MAERRNENRTENVTPDTRYLVADGLRRWVIDYAETGQADLDTVVAIFEALATLIEGMHAERDSVAARARAAEELANILRPFAATGEKVRRAAALSNAPRSKQAQHNFQAWQEEANRLWGQPQHAGKSTSDVARLIAKRTGGNPNTIRRRIKKVS